MPKTYQKKPPQICSTEGCENPAAYKTNSRPAYCESCINGIFEAHGLKLMEPFKKPDDYYLCECLTCGEQSHYRFNFVLSGDVEKATCRVCSWRDWYAWGRSINAVPSSLTDISLEDAEQRAERVGFDLVKVIHGEFPGECLCVGKCKTCGRIQIDRQTEFPIGHKCRIVKSKEPVGNRAGSEGAIGVVEKQYKVTSNQRKVAREFLDIPKLKPLAQQSDLSWWNFEKNDNKLLFTLTPKARKPIYTYCLGCGAELLSPACQVLSGRLAYFGRCEECKEKERQEQIENSSWMAMKKRLEGKTISDIPELMEWWDDDEFNPRTAPAWTRKQYRWKCPNGHHPRQRADYILQNGCSSCKSNKTREEKRETEREKMIPTIVPVEMSEQWHPDKNKKFEYGKTALYSTHPVWWLCDHCGYEWEESLTDRQRPTEEIKFQNQKTFQRRCPNCGGVFDSLAWNYPSLAREWSSGNPLSAWDIQATQEIEFIPQWVCSTDSRHVWNMSISSRIKGAECPECRESGKSKIEKAYCKRAGELWRHAVVKSGVSLREETFSRPWVVDIFVAAEKPFAVEYDGEYWHSDKREVDKRKSRELLSAGYRLVRLREGSLFHLGIDDPSYLELSVLPSGEDMDSVLDAIANWAF